MGAVLGRLYYELYNEVVWLNDKWREYTDLFGTSEERIALLDRSASRFFGFLQHALFEDALLHLARLTDSPRSGGHPTLSIRRLPHLIADGTLRAEVAELIDAAQQATAFATDWRHRYIAHRNLPLALDQPGEVLAEASRGHVNEALSAIEKVLNRIHSFYFGGESRFDVPGGPGDALDLLRILQLGVQAEDARDERLRLHKPLSDDVKHPAI